MADLPSNLPDQTSLEISILSKHLPPFLIEQYERTLALFNISPLQPFLNTSEQFLDLYKKLDSTIHSSFTLPTSGDVKYVALTYTYYILKDLGWDVTNIKKYVIKDFLMDPNVSILVSSLKKEVISSVMAVIGNLDLQLGNYQCDRYRLAVCVLIEKGSLSTSLTFTEMYEIIKAKLDNDWDSLGFTGCVLQRSCWGNLKDLQLLATPNITLEQPRFQRVDLSLVVADYFCNMTDSDYRSAKVLISTLHMNRRRVSDLSIIDFTLLLVNSNIVQPGDVSKIEDTRRYPLYFNNYKRRFEENKILFESSNHTLSMNMLVPEEETREELSITTSKLSSDMSAPVSCTDVLEERDGQHHIIDIKQTQLSKLVTNASNTVSGFTVLSDRGYTKQKKIEKGDTKEDTPLDNFALKLDTSPHLNDVVRLLTPIAHRWELIGMCLNLEYEKRPLPNCGLSNIKCLSKVLEEWMNTKCSKVTWRNLLDIVDNTLHERQLATEIKNIL